MACGTSLPWEEKLDLIEREVTSWCVLSKCFCNYSAMYMFIGVPLNIFQIELVGRVLALVSRLV